MRQIVLDTETTGLDPASGHRIIEIGCIELSNRRITKRHYHQYLNPEREIDAGAIEVHGLTTEFLSGKPLFADIAEEFLAFVRGAELIIHNAPFDVGFIDHELHLLGENWGDVAEHCSVFDTLPFARDLHPGQRNSLDALCRRYEIDNGHRELHGALLDAELLADVYLAMTGGQVDLQLSGDNAGDTATDTEIGASNDVRTDIRVIAPNADEITAHTAYLTGIEQASESGCVWLREEQ